MIDDFERYLEECDERSSDDDVDATTPSSWRANAVSPLCGTAKRVRLAKSKVDAPFKITHLSHRVKDHTMRTEIDIEIHEYHEAACIAIDAVICIAQQSNSFFTISTNGLEWSATPECVLKQDQFRQRPFGGPLVSFILECLKFATVIRSIDVSTSNLQSWSTRIDCEPFPTSGDAALEVTTSRCLRTSVNLFRALLSSVSTEILRWVGVNNPDIADLFSFFRRTRAELRERIMPPVLAFERACRILRSENANVDKYLCKRWIDSLCLFVEELQTAHQTNESNFNVAQTLLLSALCPWQEAFIKVCTGSILSIAEETWKAEAPKLFSSPINSSSVIDAAAACEGLVSNLTWRERNNLEKKSVGRLRNALIGELSANSTNQTRLPLHFCVGHTQFVAICPQTSCGAHFSKDASRGARLHIDVSVPVSQLMSSGILEPIMELARSCQEEYVKTLFTRQIEIATFDEFRTLNFHQSLNFVFGVGLLEEWDFVDRFIDKIVQLPEEWWLHTPRLIESAFADALGSNRSHLVQLVVGEEFCEASDDMLKLFQSLTIKWHLPRDHMVILIPHMFYNQSSDAYSKWFRLVVALLVVKRQLLSHWKASRWSSSNPALTMHASYALDALLSFILTEVGLLRHQLRQAVVRERRDVAHICSTIDTSLSQLETISLQIKSNESLEAIFSCVLSVVRCASQVSKVSPQLASSQLSDRFRASICGLLTALHSIPQGTNTREKLEPLLLRLTFNGYFRTEITSD